MSVLEALITADRVVLAGLSAYDQAMANAWATAVAKMAKAGVPAEQIEAAKEAHDERTLSGRGRLHREVWTKALATLAAGPAEAA